MGKSSASLKKKGSKKSSKAKASSKRKSGKYKSKKVSRREVSLSSSDYDDSTSMDTSMSSSSEDSHRKKRGRSHSRKDVKGHKKVRRRSHSRDSSEDSLYTRKRKKMKRKNEYEVRKKTYQKKKRVRREASVSPGGSGSRSCSTCQGGNSGSDDDSQYESRRGRSERKEKDKRKLKRGRSRNEKSSRHRTRSCSPCTPCSESFAEGAKDKYVGETNSRRLRSVITVARVAEESGELYRNETNEEIVDDHDYPCRSNDSNDGGTKRESDHHILSSSEEKLRVENEIEDMSADFNFVDPKTIDKSHIDRINFQAYSAGTIETMKETNETGANLDTNDLESILRQRALENLKRFRGEIQSTAKASDQKYKNVNQKKQPITNKHEKVQGKSIVNNADIGTKFSKLTPVEETSFSVSRRNLNANPTNNEIISNMDKDTSSSTMHHLACPQGKVTDAGNLSENVTKSNNCRTNNPKLTKPESHYLLQSQSTLKQTTVSGLPQEQLKLVESTKDIGISAHVVSHSSNDNDNVNVIRGTTSGVPKHSIHSPKFRHNNTNRGKDEVKEQSQFEPKQTSASNEPPNEKYLVSENDVEKNAATITRAAVQIINNSGSDVDKSHNSATPKSCIESSSLENNSGNLQDESNPGSQFEQKTMTVMRGGELVQVSYKVYIPKKAPALSRRQLKR